MKEGAFLNKSESKYFNTAVRFDKALLFLLEKKPFEYITIREICEKAEVNRSTFYLHYENTVDLLKETIRYVLDNFCSYFSSDVVSDDIEKIATKYENCDLQELDFINEKYLHPYLLFIKENQRVFSAMLSQPKTFDTTEIFHRLFDNVFKPILDRFHYPRDEQNYVMMFYLNGITAIIAEWLKDDCQKSIEDISMIIQGCIHGRKWQIPIY
ncbi:MAG: TetR/AcrR family transcriptional regulator [Ruminococcaceae bacterium]|nr:TetR/AcrR family transcriptional regulator [Oscillospiraceae bacterium]